MDVGGPAVLVALGSNIEPATHLPLAVELLAGEVEVKAASAVYASPPVDAPGAPEFLNAVVRVSADLGPRTLKFGVLRSIESRLGRLRQRDRNAPRTIDLDLILYGDLVERSYDLQLPDPDLVSQAHLIVPAGEVAGDLSHPIEGATLAELARRVESRLTRRPEIQLLPGR